MQKYEIKQFNIPKLKGISEKNIEEHLKLYAGYVNNTNLILEQIEKQKENPDFGYAINELQRRFSFEFNGMKNHELYFESFENSPQTPNAQSNLYIAIQNEWGSFENWLQRFKNMAKTRGVGWAILYYDQENKKLLNGWVDEQHLGHLLGLKPILALDMWEHSFVFDYQPSGKPQYVEDFFENINWTKIEDRFNSDN